MKSDILKTIICGSLIIFLLCGCTETTQKGYTTEEKDQIKHTVLDILRTRHYLLFELEKEEYDNKSNTYIIYAVSQDGSLRVKVDVSEPEFKDGELTTFEGPVSFWDGEKYIPEVEFKEQRRQKDNP